MFPRVHPSLLLTLSAVAAVPAQQLGSRTTAIVTPEGVFYEHARAPVAQALGTNPSPMGLRWTYSQASTRSIVDSTSVGNHGTLGWLGLDLNNQRLSLVGMAEDSTPPNFVFEAPMAGISGIDVKAADKAPACAVAVLQSGSGTLEYYVGGSSTPLWTVSYQHTFEIAISDDGRYVAAGYSPTQNTSQVDVYDANSATPSTPIQTLTATTHGFRHLDISGDGSTVLLATNTRDHVFDVATGNELFNATTVSHDAHTINRDGTVFARAGFNPIRAWWRTGGVYNEVLTFNDTSLGFAVHTAADVSADGTTFVCAGYDAQANARMRVHCFTLTPTGSTLLWSFVSDGSGQYQTTPQAVSVSDDGKYIAVGSWGTQNNDHAEALLFDRDVGPVPIATVDTPGSVFDLDLSGDGQFLVIGTKSVHANVFGNGGEAYSFDRGGQDHWLVGTPSIGRTIDLRTGGSSGEPVFIGLATGLGSPIPIPGVSGALELDLGSAVFLFAGSVPPSGVHSLSLVVPNVPFFIGTSIYTQALTMTAPAFSNPLLLWLTP
ncbi:MAG TPA: hypothetical protein VK081_13405 [Planctomycetota bacterium]|nr:hypothetical protein [Planctomycetota bacterium]